MTTATMPAGCAYCNGIHMAVCPRIAEIEYHPDGTVKRVVLRERQWAPMAPVIVGPGDATPTLTWLTPLTTGAGETP